MDPIPWETCIIIREAHKQEPYLFQDEGTKINHSLKENLYSVITYPLQQAFQWENNFVISIPYENVMQVFMKLLNPTQNFALLLLNFCPSPQVFSLLSYKLFIRKERLEWWLKEKFKLLFILFNMPLTYFRANILLLLKIRILVF